MDADLHSPDPRFFKGLALGLLICTPLWVAVGFTAFWAVHS